MKLFCKHKQNELIVVQEERRGEKYQGLLANLKELKGLIGVQEEKGGDNEITSWILDITLTLKCLSCGKLHQIAYQDREDENEQSTTQTTRQERE